MRAARLLAVACAFLLLCVTHTHAADDGPKKKPVIIWLPPLPITAGTPLGPNQLNAISTVPGTFEYDPPAGTILPAGRQTLSVDFIPTDDDKYETVKDTRVQITVIPKESPEVTWKNPADIKYGIALGPDQLNAKANVPGTFSYSPPSGSYLGAGPGQVLTVTFNPDNALLYGVVTKAVKINVTAALLTATASAATRSYGTPNSTFSITYAGFVNGDTPASIDVLPTATCTATPTSNAGSNFAIVPAGGADPNYSFKYANGTLTITKAALTAKADDKTRKFGLDNPPLTITYSGFVNGESAVVIDTAPYATTTATVTSPIGTYPIALVPGSDNNYEFAYSPGTFTITGASGGGAAPIISSFQVVEDEDSKLGFEYKTFQQNFSSQAGDSIVAVKIVEPPLKGTLSWMGNKVHAGDFVTADHGKLVDLIYVPAPDFNGRDTITWNVSNGKTGALLDALVTLYIIPVNDAPVLSYIESTPLGYSPGEPPLRIARRLGLNDVDDNFMANARIVISENYQPGDQLSIAEFTSPNITVAFDEIKGELTLKGNDSRANYEAAFQHVVFTSPVSAIAHTSSKQFSLTVNDGTDMSNVLTRSVEVTNYPEVSIVNAFTPNRDGVNDYWDFVNLDFYTKIKIGVFDQNGIRVFDCRDKDCKWDGSIMGKELAAGPYFYSIELDEGKKTYHGTVTILK